VKEHGITSAKAYPYKEKQGNCEASQHHSVASISKIKEILTNGDEELLK
jgi:Papain family cysteine protease